MSDLDNIDLAILKALQINARITNAELANKVPRSVFLPLNPSTTATKCPCKEDLP